MASRLLMRREILLIPTLHDAVAHEPSPNVTEGTVIRQLRKGFKLKDRLIRPASVIVSKGPPTS